MAILKDLDKPISPEEKSGLLKKGRIRIIIIFEDLSFKEYFIILKSNYRITINKRDYIMIPSAIVRGINPTLVYYFNNPFPIKFEYQRSELSAWDLRTKEERERIKEEEKALPLTLEKIKIDAEAIYAAFSSSLISNLYRENRFTVKMLLIIIAVVIVVILVLLQATGKIDIIGFFSSAAAKK